MPFFYFDYYYLLLVVPALIIAMVAQIKVQSTYKKYAQIASRSGITASEMTRRMLDTSGLTHVDVVHIGGNLADNFNPKKQTISLSDPVYGSSSVAALGVAAHEAGHALQHAEGYFPLVLRSAIVPITQFGSAITPWLIILGLIFSFPVLIDVGIVFFGLAVFFQLVTLPVEFNASRRALASLESSGVLAADELGMTKRVLSAAAMTYVAGLLVSLMSFLRILLLFGNRRKEGKR